MPATDIPLNFASNLRDLGGWPTQDGRHVRRGVVFRASALSGLSAADQAVVASLGLRCVVDFRGAHERSRRKVEIAGAAGHILAIEPSVGAGLADILRTGQVSGHLGPDDMMGFLAEAYRDYALQNFVQYRGLFDLLLQDGALPLLMHCSAGKDRTGFGAALLLSALGVAWPDVMEDYLATNRFWRREIAGDFTMSAEIADILMSAHAPLLEAGFEAMRRQYGSLEAYLAGPIGLTPEKRARLAELLLVA
jgi:protein-tyrosine phosphatase